MSTKTKANDTRTETLNPADLEQVVGGFCGTPPGPTWPPPVLPAPLPWPPFPPRPPVRPGPDPVPPRFPPIGTLPMPLPTGMDSDSK